jgi:peptidoglycan/xylan/chitin deacetylase (PgdA/CDA1 family)
MWMGLRARSGALRRDPSLADKPSLMSMGDFGPTVGLPRILGLLDRNAVPATFFVPGGIAERHPDPIGEIVSLRHEIAHHGYMHEPPATFGPDEDEGATLDRASRILAEITGAPPRGYRSPSWELSEDTLPLLKEQGFVYDSSLMGSDIPYLADTPGGEIVEIPVHWSLDDVPYYSWSPVQGRVSTLASPETVYDTWKLEFDGTYREGGAVVLTMHPFVSGHHSRVQMLDRLIKYMKSRPHVAFMRCIDVAEGWTPAGME